jgi:hypothetical protein
MTSTSEVKSFLESTTDLRQSARTVRNITGNLHWRVHLLNIAALCRERDPRYINAFNYFNRSRNNEQRKLMYYKNVTGVSAYSRLFVNAAQTSNSVWCEFHGSRTANIRYFEHWPGHSPTVTASWFVAKTHLASFYYNVQRDYTIVRQICDEVVDVYKESVGNIQSLITYFPLYSHLSGVNVTTKKYNNCSGSCHSVRTH